MADYTSDHIPTPATGIVGTVLGGTALAGVAGLLGGNGLGGLFNNSSNCAMQMQIAAKDSEIALLKAGQETDKKLVDVYTVLRENQKEIDAKIAGVDARVLALETAAPLREQIVLGQVQSVAQSLASNTAALQASITGIQTCLSGITKCVVPNSSVCPGWGNVTITPATSGSNAAT